MRRLIQPGGAYRIRGGVKMNMIVKNRVIEKDEMERMAPSIFTQTAHGRTSSKYSHIPTARLVDELKKYEWLPVLAAEGRVRIDDRKGFQKHMIRFRHKSTIEGSKELQVNDCIPEIVLSNSHDGFASFQLDAGLFRLVCSNGLIVSNGSISTIKIRHMGYADEAVRSASDEIISCLPNLKDKVQKMAEIELTEEEAGVFAKSAAGVRWENEEMLPVDPKWLLYKRRVADDNKSLWNAFNAVQENIIKGGIRQLPKNIKKPWERRHTRAVNSVAENIRINRALWALAEGMRQLKTVGKLEAELN